MDNCATALSARFPSSTDTQNCAPVEQTDGIHSPDCEELDPNKRHVRRTPKQHRAVVGFIVVLDKYLLLNSHVQQRIFP